MTSHYPIWFASRTIKLYGKKIGINLGGHNLFFNVAVSPDLTFEYT